MRTNSIEFPWKTVEWNCAWNRISRHNQQPADKANCRHTSNGIIYATRTPLLLFKCVCFCRRAKLSDGKWFQIFIEIDLFIYAIHRLKHVFKFWIMRTHINTVSILHRASFWKVVVNLSIAAVRIVFCFEKPNHKKIERPLCIQWSIDLYELVGERPT